jgi:predicted phosphodiesterase
MKNYKFFFLAFLFFINGNLFGQKDDNFIVRPYLQIGQNPNSQTIEILWHTAQVDAQWSLEYKTIVNETWTKAKPPMVSEIKAKGINPRYIFTVTLNNLQPGQEFLYKISRNGSDLFSSKGKTLKAVDQFYKFIAFGDIGANTREQKDIAMQAFKTNPDFVALTGDIVYNRGLISEYDSKFWPIYNGEKADSNGVPMMSYIPFVAAPGNHDIETRNLDSYPEALAYYMFWSQPLNGPQKPEGSVLVPQLIANEENRASFLKSVGGKYPTMANFSFDYGNAHWTVLDSNPYVDWTNKEILDWVDKDLEAAKNATWHFVMFHHPGFNSSRAHYEQQHMRLLSPIFEKNGVDVVFNGHVHNYQRSFPLTFKPDDHGDIVASEDLKRVRGRIVSGKWTLDKKFDGKKVKAPKGVIYIVSGAGGNDLYNVDLTTDTDNWMKFTSKFVSDVHSFTLVEVNAKTLEIKQITATGKVLDKFVIEKK